MPCGETAEQGLAISPCKQPSLIPGARLKLWRKSGHETLGKMDLMDLMDLMDMPQWQQNNYHGTHAGMSAGSTRLVCERPG